MANHTLAMTSSSGEPHQIEIAFLDDGRVSMECSCMGGQMGTLCKHRKAVIGGDDSAVVEADRPHYFEIFQGIGSTGLPAAYRTYCWHLEQIDIEKAALKGRVDEIRRAFVQMLSEGI